MNFNTNIMYELLRVFINDDNWTISVVYHSNSCFIYYKKELIACVYYNERRKIKKGHLKQIINEVLNGLHLRGHLRLTCKLEKKCI